MARQKIEGSTLFSVERKDDTNYLHTEFVGDGFTARNIQESDLPFYETLFSDENVVKLYGDGSLKSAEWVRGRFDTWNKRFFACQPHGGLTVIDNETNKPIGHVVAGGGSEGAAELAAVFDVSSQNKRICTRLLDEVVKVWAREVRKIGLGEIKDSRFPDLAKAFSCFHPKHTPTTPHPVVLRRLDSTYSPLDIYSAKALKRAGFVMATTHLSEEKVFDLRGTGLAWTNVDHLKEIASRFFDEKIGRVANQRYKCIDNDGDEHTISYKDNFKAFRFHVERSVGGVGI